MNLHACYQLRRNNATAQSDNIMPKLYCDWLKRFLLNIYRNLILHNLIAKMTDFYQESAEFLSHCTAGLVEEAVTRRSGK